MLHTEPYVKALGAMTGNQAVQQVLAGLKAIYLSGWQVAGDANLAGQMYPDQSLYPCNSVPNVVKEINNAFLRADQMHHAEGKNGMYWFAPIVADAEAGFGGNLNAFELMKSMIEAGAAGILGLLEIVFGVLFGVLFFHEHVSVLVMVGILTILAAAAIPYIKDYSDKKGTLGAE